MARLLCKYEADLTLRDARGDCYLHMAIACRASKVLRLLVSQGCTLTFLGGRGQTLYIKQLSMATRIPSMCSREHRYSESMQMPKTMQRK